MQRSSLRFPAAFAVRSGSQLHGEHLFPGFEGEHLQFPVRIEAVTRLKSSLRQRGRAGVERDDPVFERFQFRNVRVSAGEDGTRFQWRRVPWIPMVAVREEEAADIIISAVTYLECIGCRDIEQLIKDKVAYNERKE